jgi:hypothetical protein
MVWSSSQEFGFTNRLKTPFYFEEKIIGRLLRMNFVATEWVLNERIAFKMTSVI